MRLRVLGAHNCQSRDTRTISLLVDGVLCLDAGSLSAGLTFEEQARVRTILLTHWHFDHLQGIPTFAINRMGMKTGAAVVCSIDPVLRELKSHLINGTIYPTFTEPSSPGGASLALRPIEPMVETVIDQYRIMAVPVAHGIPAVGYQITSAEGKSIFYTGDTSGALAHAWDAVDPALFVTEVTFPNAMRGSSKHMAPIDLEMELAALKAKRGSIPPVLLVHMTPWLEDDIRQEVAVVASKLGASIMLGSEGMELDV